MSGTSCVQKTPVCTSSNTCSVAYKTTQRACKQDNNNCIQSVPSCSSNRCVSTSVTVLNATCDSTTGTCARKVECKVDCDCAQGLTCANGKCLSGIIPVYCCSKAGCPAGSKCTDANGNGGYCPNSTDCDKQGGYCTTQGTACRTGYKPSTISCGGALSRSCCMPDQCANKVCPAPTCAEPSKGSCTQKTSSCEPSSGNCTSTSKTYAPVCSAASGATSCSYTTYTCTTTGTCAKRTSTATQVCSMSGTTCTQATPSCTNTGCTYTRKSVAQTCVMSGTTCTQTSPACTNGACTTSAKSLKPACKQSNTDCVQYYPACNTDKECSLATSRVFANSSCNSTTGLCSLTTTSCKTHCDCIQGATCVSGSDGRGTCVIGTKPTYCCSKANCPLGEPCYTTDGKQSTCGLIR